MGLELFLGFVVLALAALDSDLRFWVIAVAAVWLTYRAWYYRQRR